ncbi:DUF4097 domain-containing protein [Actinomadura sp. ATCC 31491]|uniref:DUF4097 domain-containing protein n=1 Tax=Actinomadura luzonensis TaxID=2805427 RepID=A0ABT0FUR3_9ACTN|nr:DUF4097 family beta strand repeat-containing protein [Actinomadura luzonensis]MCK2215715.1 DUF4097 domain-containing protein [Actinomadura luzonensis]
MTMKRITVIAGVLALPCLGMATGCGLTGETNHSTGAYEVPDAVTALRVTADEGEVEVIGSDRRTIAVTERLSWRKNKPATSHEVRDGTLELKFDCPTTFGFGTVGVECEVGYRVEVPKGLRVEVSSDSGDLKLTGLSGELRARTDSGAIGADGLAGGRVTATTDSGDVTLAFTGPPDAVTTESDSGRTVVRVPGGPYDVRAETDSGEKKITAATSASAQRRIRLRSDSGDLEVATP